MSPAARAELTSLAEDMHAAAITTGDRAERGGTRQFAAARAVRADDLLRHVSDEQPDIWDGFAR